MTPLDDRPLAGTARGCGKRPCHLVYGRARCEWVLGLTGSRCEVNPECGERQCKCNTMQVKSCTHTSAPQVMDNPRHGLGLNPFQMRGLSGGKDDVNSLHVFSQQIVSTVRVEGDCLRSANTPWSQIFILRSGQGTAKRYSFISAALCSWLGWK